MLSALLGVDLNSRLSNVEGGSATSLDVIGTGDVIVGGGKSGNVITLTRGNQSWDNLSGKPATFTPASHIHSASDITSGIFNIARIPTGTSGTTVALGNHLHTGVYEPAFSKNTAFNKNFGTTSGTVAQGNDSRIINGQTAYGWGNHASAGYALNSALTAHTGNTTVHITSNERTNWNDANSKKHTHGNKSVIDALTQGHINVLNKLSLDEQGNVKVDATLWATGGISALGLGDGGSSGGGVDMLDSWANYTEAKANYYVPASLLVTFRSDALGRLTSLENGSATSFDTTGSGNAITSVSKSGNTLIFTKGSTFSLSGHSHTIADVTGLQTALNGKQATLTQGSNIIISGSTISAVDTTYGVATTSANGLMSSADKVKLNGIAANANNYSLPTASASVLGGIKVGSRLTISSGVLSANVQSDNNFTTAYKNKLDGIETGANNYVHPSSHPASMITGLHASATTGVAGSVAWGNVTGKPSTFAPSTHTHSNISITAGTGLSGGGTLEANRTFALGTPSTLTKASTNAVTSTSHTHAITTTTVGAANTIVATDASGAVRGNIIRIGGNWTLELSGTELLFKYDGEVKQRMFQDGSFVATGGVAAFSQGVEADTLDLLRLKLNQGGGDSKYLSSTATQIYFDIGGATPLSMTKTEVRRGNTDNNVNLGTSAYPWANIYGVNLIASTNISTPKITLGNGWTIEQTASSLTIKRNGIVKGTFNA